MILAPNSEGPCDHRLQSVSFRDQSGGLKAVLWSMACHPVGTPGSLRVSSDYPGWVRRHLRFEHSSDLTVVFLQGFTGNIRPDVTRPWHHVLRPRLGLYSRVNLLFNRRIFGGFRDPSFATWAHSLAQRVSESLKGGEPLSPQLAADLVAIPMSDLVRGQATTDQLLVRALYLSADLVFVALSAEPVVEYRAHVERAFAPAQVVPIGYTDHVFGYLPTASMLAEGGYEAEGFVKWLGMDGGLRPEAEANVCEGLERLAARFEHT